MGCTSSATAVATARRNRSPRKPAELRPRPSVIVGDHACESPAQRYEMISYGINSVGAPANMLAIVCLRKEAIPIVTSLIHFEDSTPTRVKLPIVASSLHEKGRVMVYSQVSFFMPKTIHKADTAKLLLNTLSWVSGGFASMTRVGVMGFSKAVLPVVTKTLQGLGFFVEPVKYTDSLAGYKSIVCPSTIEVTKSVMDTLVEYVSSGGGLAVFYQHGEDSGDNIDPNIPVNQLLMKFGLCYTFCLLNGDLDDAANIQLAKSYSDIEDANFISILDEFKRLVNTNDVQPESLDDLVVTLRYYLMVADDTYVDEMKEVVNCCWDFLRRTNYSTKERGLCPEPMHGIVIVLLQDLYVKLPISMIDPVPEHVEFPGPTGNVELSTIDMKLELSGDDTWISTGLWLPVGVVAHVWCQGDTSNLIIRVGSHSESLLGVKGPWKRWPSVVSTFRMSDKEEEIGTPCGGIVYAGLNVPYDAVDWCGPRTVDFAFENFCRCPEWRFDHPELWDETKNLDVPWGEVEFANIIFTMPTKEMRKIKNFEKLGDFYNRITETVSKYLSFTISRAYRVIFDVEVPEPDAPYPLFWNLDAIEATIFDFEKPSVALFDSITLLALSCFRYACVDSITETALSAIAAAVAFQAVYKDFDPLKFESLNLPVLFRELWIIHLRFPDLIPQALAEMQSPDYLIRDCPEDNWIEFVKQLCKIGQLDFTGHLGNVRPIPMGTATPYTVLKVFDPDASEEEPPAQPQDDNQEAAE